MDMGDKSIQYVMYICGYRSIYIINNHRVWEVDEFTRE